MLSVESFLNRLRQTAAGRAIEQEDAAAVLATRKARAAQRAALVVKQAAASLAYTKAQAARGAAIAKASAALEAVMADPTAAVAGGVAIDLEHQVARVEAELRKTQPAEIAGFVRELEELAAQLYPGRFVEVDVRPWLGVARPAGSNYRAIQAWATRRRKVEADAWALAIEALTPAELAARLDALREELGDLPTAADVTAPADADRACREAVQAFHRGWSHIEPSPAT
ncbi:MAG TPA: hypothetical protein VJU18_05315 [Vicinamibacteria bacterium]|nr:hypothetical protein [Vicinamibacteria bacterium]